MSELKYFFSTDGRVCTMPAVNDFVYLKSEADEVIAELQSDYKEACDRLQTANLIKDEQLAANRHNKYKRCMAMARWCELGISYWDDDEQEGGWEYKKLRHCIRWKKRWLELAEKFKEAK